jgi:hypothetical protein
MIDTCPSTLDQFLWDCIEDSASSQAHAHLGLNQHARYFHKNRKEQRVKSIFPGETRLPKGDGKLNIEVRNWLLGFLLLQLVAYFLLLSPLLFN